MAQETEGTVSTPTMCTYTQPQLTNPQPNGRSWTMIDADESYLVVCLFSERVRQCKSSALSIQNWSAMMSSCRTVGIMRVLCCAPSCLTSGCLTTTEPCRRPQVQYSRTACNSGMQDLEQPVMHLSEAGRQATVVDVKAFVKQLVLEVRLCALHWNACLRSQVGFRHGLKVQSHCKLRAFRIACASAGAFPECTSAQKQVLYWGMGTQQFQCMGRQDAEPWDRTKNCRPGCSRGCPLVARPSSHGDSDPKGTARPCRRSTA